MAAVPRMLAAKEVGSKALVHVPVVVKIAHDADDDGDDGSSANPSRRGVGAKANDAGGGSGGVSTLHLVTPCLLPTSLDRIISIETVGHRYFQNTIRPMCVARALRVCARLCVRCMCVCVCAYVCVYVCVCVHLFVPVCARFDMFVNLTHKLLGVAFDHRCH